jgi:hypothetical protein
MIIIFYTNLLTIREPGIYYSNYLLKNHENREPINELFVMFSKTMKIENRLMNCV